MDVKSVGNGVEKPVDCLLKSGAGGGGKPRQASLDNPCKTSEIACGWIGEIWRWLKNDEDRARGTPGLRNARELGGYFSELLMLLKVPVSAPPTPLTAVMIAIAMPAAMRPYSMAVAADSS